jgi:hypothetical protein
MECKSMAKFGGLCAILAGIAYIVIGVTYLLQPEAQRADAAIDEFLTSVAEGHTVLMVYYWAFALASLFMIGAVMAISELVRPSCEGWIRWTCTLAIVGYALVAIQFLLMQDHTPKLAAGYVVADESTRAALAAMGTRYLDPDYWIGFGTVGLWVLSVNWLAIRGGQFPKPLAYVGLLAGLAYWLVVAGGVFEIELLVAIAAGAGGIILGPIFLIWIGFVLRSTPGETGEAA